MKFHISASALLAFALLVPWTAGQDRFDGAQFTGVDKKLVDAARKSMDDHLDAYYYVCTNHANQLVLRASREALTQPNGAHPERRAPARDIVLGSFGGQPSFGAMQYVRAMTFRHNLTVAAAKREGDVVASRPPIGRRGTPPVESTKEPPTKPPADDDVAEAPKIELTQFDRLLMLIGVEVSVEHTKLSGVSEFSKYTSEAWALQYDRLRRGAPRADSDDPADRALVAAFERLEPVADAIRTSVAEQAALVKLNAPLYQELTRIASKYSNTLVHAEYDRYSEDQLEELRRRGGRFENEVDEFRASRARRNRLMKAERAPVWAKIDENTLAMEGRIRPLLWDAEVRRNAASTVLVPALRERAGPPRTTSGLTVLFTAVPHGGGSHDQGYLSIESQFPRELTELSLLVKIETSAGDRFMPIFVAKLPTHGLIRTVPIDLSGASVTGDASYAGPRPKVNEVRYAAWCSQFHTERQTATIVTPEEMVVESWLQTVRPGTVYVTRGGTTAAMSPTELALARRRDPSFRMEREADRRFELIFRKVAKGREDYSVEFDLIDHEDSGKTERFRGSFQLPPIKHGKFGDILHHLDFTKFGEMPKPEECALIVNAKSRTGEMQLELSGWWNSFGRQWRAKGGPASARQFVPAGEIPAADSPEGIAKERLAAATTLLKEGKFDEAKAALDKIAADYPETEWEAAAKFALSRIGQMQAGRKKLEELNRRRPRAPR